MGFLDRLGKIATGFGGALQAPFGLVYDMARAPFVDDDELDGFVNVLYGRTAARGGQLLGNVLGPEEGVGAFFGGLPEYARGPVRTVTTPVLHHLEQAGREVIREPLTAALSTVSLGQAESGGSTFGGFEALISPEKWREGYRIAQDRSLGQAFALAILTDDITDEAKVAQAMGSDWYEALSGTMDATARLFLDVDVAGGKALKGFRRATVAGKAGTTTVRLGRAGRALGIGEKIEVAPGALEQVGAALYRAAPEGLQKYGGRSIRSGRDVEAAITDPRLTVVNETINELKRQEGLIEAEAPTAAATEDVVARVAEGEDVTAPPVATPPSYLPEDFQPVKFGDLKPGMEVQPFGGRRGAPAISGEYVETGMWKEGDPSKTIKSVLDLEGKDLTDPAFRQQLLDEGWLPEDIDTKLNARLVWLVFEDGSISHHFPAKFEVRAASPKPSTTAPEMAVNVERAVTLEDVSYALPEQGKPGYGIEKTGGVDPDAPPWGMEPAQEVTHFVYRDADGKVGAVLKIEPDDAGTTVATRADLQRRGIATRLLNNARQAGVDVERLAGKAGFTAEGAAFTKGRRAKDPAAPPPGAVAPPPAAVTPPAKDPAAVDRVAARVRDLAFHNHRDGAIISRILAESDDLTVAWGALMGHGPSIEQFFAQQPELAGVISRLSGDQARISELRRMGFELPDEVLAIERSQKAVELDSLYGVDIEAKLQYWEQAVGTVRDMPRISALSQRRSEFTRSTFFQANPLAAPLRLAINMRPRNFVDLHDAAGDEQVTRLLRKSRLDVAEQDRLRGAYMAATDPGARNIVLNEIEAASIRSVAARHGITDPKRIDELLSTAVEARTSAMTSLGKSRQYDGKGRSLLEDVGDDGVTQRMYQPIAATQEINQFILPDLDAIGKILERDGADISRVGLVAAAGGETLQAFQRLWKPSVLLRVGWPLRVVTEEQIRIMSQIGALVTLGRTAMAVGRYAREGTADVLSNLRQATQRIPKDQRTFRGDLSAEQAAARRGIPLGHIDHRGVRAEMAFGTQETFNDVARNLNSARGSFEYVVKESDDIRNGLRTEVLGEWQSLEPRMRGYSEGWENAVNNQIGKDEMWRQFVEGKSIDEVRDWLDNTAEGRKYARRMRHWRGREDQWLDVAKQVVDDYLPDDGLRALALEGKAKIADLERLVPDAGQRPVVHGAMLADIQGRTRFTMALGKLRDKAMKTLGTTPTDVLSRNPFFDYKYTAEAERLIDISLDQGIDLTPEMIRSIEGKARNYALGESKRLLYDLADESELSHMLRFISPFYSAWQEVLTRWTGITVQDPVFVSRLHEVWRAPERMGIVTDENGATINGDGTATSVLGEKVEAGKDRFVNFKLLASDNVTGKYLFNDLTRHIPGVKLAENAKFNKKGANLILQGAPGVGPVVQIPLNEIAKGRPELEDSLRWALPFGATQSTMDMLLPATARRIKTKAGGEEDRLYSNQLMRIYWDMQVDYNLDKRAEPPTYAEAKKKTDAFYNVRTVASFVSPVAPSFQSPYQFYIDAHRALKEKDPETADEVFLRTYRDEFFPLTQSLSKTMDGIPPTLEGAEARQRYVDLIEKHPELGGLIVGSEGAGEFSSAVYQSQLQKPVAPGAADKQRQAFSFEEARDKPNERLGWMTYSQAMDLIDAERMNRGLPNLQVKGAQDLANIKREVIRALATKYPEWHAAFSVTDRDAWNRKIGGMRDIAADDRLAGRPEIQGLRTYLQARDLLIDELRARKAAGGASTLSAAGNHDLSSVWDQITAKLTDGNNAFSQLYYRYLERDPLDIETGRGEAA